MANTARNATLAFFVVLAASCGGSQSAPAVDDKKPVVEEKPVAAPAVVEYDAKTIYENTSFGGASFSHDESRVLVHSDQSGVSNLYVIPAAGGEAVSLTKSESESIYSVSFFPSDDRLLYSSDKGGNEINHLFVLEPDKEAKDLTPAEKGKASFYGWSGDKKSFYVTTNERDPKAFDLYRYATDKYKRKLVFKNTGNFSIGDMSPDGRYVALGKTRTNADSDIYLVDLKARSKRKRKPALITKHEGAVDHGVMEFSRDSKHLYYSTNGHGEFSQIWSYELGTKAAKAELTAEWDVSYVTFSDSGRYRVSATNADARTVLKVFDTQSKEDVEIANLPSGDITSARFSKSENMMAFYLSSDTAPRNLYVLDIASGEHKRLTQSLNAKIDPKNLVEGEVVRYKSFDGLEIPAILYRPHQSKTGKVPALVSVHGGPGGQSRLGYSPSVQHLVNHGYAVLRVNNRGSSGYGKTFYHLDDRNHGEGDLNDCVYGRKYLESLDWVDGSKVGISGGSYGGYMVLAALAFQPEAFNVGVDIFGVANWLRTLESIPPWWASFRDYLYAEIGDPKTDRERLTRISPLFHADKIKRPLLVIQGANDPRVLKVESDEIVAAVKKNNVPVEYLVFDDEGHGFRKKNNRIRAAEVTLKFLDAHLR